MKNPNWQRDEIVLALDLYFDLEYGEMHDHNPKIIELSRILNSLPFHEFASDGEKYRNPNSVAMKLNNFKVLDTNYPGTGLTG
jgi:5-methylcytosine-specific restriction protein A